jgi:hypothetical protein
MRDFNISKNRVQISKLFDWKSVHRFRGLQRLCDSHIATTKSTRWIRNKKERSNQSVASNLFLSF